VDDLRTTERYVIGYYIKYNMGLKNIKVEENTWWELNKLKVEWRLKTLSAVVSELVKSREK